MKRFALKAFCAVALLGSAILVGPALGGLGIAITGEAPVGYKIGAMYGLGGAGLAAVGYAGQRLKIKSKSMWEHVLS